MARSNAEGHYSRPRPLLIPRACKGGSRMYIWVTASYCHKGRRSFLCVLHFLFNLEVAYIVYDMVYFDINIELLTGRF
jgi:hypothetical protein